MTSLPSPPHKNGNSKNRRLLREKRLYSPQQFNFEKQMDEPPLVTFPIFNLGAGKKRNKNCGERVRELPSPGPRTNTNRHTSFKYEKTYKVYFKLISGTQT